jgi:hypothetical protein
MIGHKALPMIGQKALSRIWPAADRDASLKTASSSYLRLLVVQ